MPTTFPFARKVLAADGLTCLAAGLLMAAGAAPLAPLTGLPEPLLRFAGLSLLPTAALFAWAARSPRLSATAIRLLAAGNVAWVLGSAAVLFAWNATPLGHVFVLGQAAVVALLAVLEHAASGLGARAAATA